MTSSIAWKYPAPRTSPTIAMSRSDSSMARNGPSFSRTCSRMPSRSNAAMLARATAAHTGCPPNVNPCVKLLAPSMNGCAMRSEAIIAPIGAYALVRPLAVVMMSGS